MYTCSRAPAWFRNDMPNARQYLAGLIASPLFFHLLDLSYSERRYFMNIAHMYAAYSVAVFSLVEEVHTVPPCGEVGSVLQ